MAEGVCALTGTTGTHVKSHLLPRAFTDKALGRPGRIEFGQGTDRPQLRYTSWFDPKLVNAKGEQILSSFDDAAARILASLGLTWRFFPITAKARRISIAESFEYIEIQDVDTESLRMFFLSVLWRFVATKNQKFKEIRIDATSKNKLRKIVAGEIKPHPLDFPCVLILLTTRGEPQVQSPLRIKIDTPPIDGKTYRPIKAFRFFFDGLIVHMSRKAVDIDLEKFWSPRIVGSDGSLRIIGRAYDGSRQKENIEALQDQLERDWPEDARRIYGAI